ncbi:MAG: peptidoglycan-associated lipoprotein Pal [Rickettsiales bacterium]|jgi:peptidoglycan-associated lipoprotein|nr:peptidoglycan-associated lipoprotein Pal [Rickettsiales bacterium]
MKLFNYVAVASIAALAACGGGIKEPADLNGQKVFFDFDSSKISKDSSDNLKGQALYMKSHPNVKMQIAGNCDERGSRDYNLALGARRANAAKNVVVKEGIAEKRIKTISYGKDRPAVKGTGESVWKQNRNATTTTL